MVLCIPKYFLLDYLKMKYITPTKSSWIEENNGMKQVFDLVGDLETLTQGILEALALPILLTKMRWINSSSHSKKQIKNKKETKTND